MSLLSPEESEESIKQGLLKDLDAKDWWFGTSMALPLLFSLPPVRLMCSICDDVEAFNLWGEESSRQAISLGKPGEQVFWFPLQCQSCKNSVIVLLVRRIGRKIMLVGRSEMEEVHVPSYIPKGQRRFYSEAIIDFQCNSVLSGLFMLRTLIEQHMRAVTVNPGLRGEALCDKYSEQLSPDFNSRFPSLGAAYGELSAALHRADEKSEIFESQLKNIEDHFEALVIFRKEVLSKGVDRVVVARWRAARRFARLLALGIDTGEGAPASR